VFNVGNGTSDIDLSVDVPIANGALTKAGPGTLRLAAANTYASGTTLAAGRLVVKNTSGSATGTGVVIVNAGILAGTGTIAGEVTINAGGTISPGDSIGTLILSNAPVFHGTNFMEIDRNGGSPLADRIVLTSGTLDYGGVLVVTNVGAAMTGGETFTLFSAPAYAGACASTNLPPLGAGLNWYLGGLIANGAIRVNREPAANPLAFTNTAPAVLQIPFTTLVANATDADADPLVVAGVSLTSTNGIVLTTNGTSVTYSNRASFTDQFSYVISDGRGGNVTGLVNVLNIGSTPGAQFVGTPTVNVGSVYLQFTATPGWTYFLQRSTNLPPTWLTISTNVAPPDGMFDHTDNFLDLIAPPASAFYRLSWPP